MYCGQCGKKVMDNMLFCPFCGSPIVIPEQDEAPNEQQKPVEKPAPVQTEEEQTALSPAYPASLFDAPSGKEAAGEEAAKEEPAEEFVPLFFDMEEKAEPQVKAEAAPEPDAGEIVDVPESPKEEPVRRPPQAKRPQNARKRPTNTYIPVKDIAPDDIFMDNDEDEYDLDEDYDDMDDDYYYEEQEEGGFFQRHVRGIVGLLLFLVLVAICAVWANTSGGQMTLARFNLAWRAEPYAELGYAAYQQNNDLMAARYYERALARDEDNYEYAHSAMVAYYEADQIESSAAMLKRCVALDPNNPEPYQEMLILYPDAKTRPWEIKELIRQGYERTGNASLLN